MQLLSNMGNCIFYNALTKHIGPRKINDIELLKNFRSENDQPTVISYYQRSPAIVYKLNSKSTDQSALWSDVATRFVYPILEDLRTGQTASAKTKLFTMLNTLEAM